MAKQPRSESRQLTELVGVRLTKDEMAAAQWFAARAGVQVPTWLRRQLLGAVSSVVAYRTRPAVHYGTDSESVAAFLTLVAKDGQR